MAVNRQWLLKSRPQGMVGREHFQYHEAEIPRPDPARGEILVRVLYLSFEPAMRGWMDDVPSYMPPVALGEPMRATGVGQVERSTHPDYPEGSLVQGMFGWQEYALASPADAMPPRLLPEGTPPTWPLSIFGGTSLTAYFGLLDVGRPRAGETVVVSGAAGATGSVVAQIARLQGCRVVGIAGGEDKCRWLREECRIDATIDYRSENVGERLGTLCPNGIDVFFDNVGGELLETAIDHIAEHGRIVLCGQISGYNEAEPAPGPRNLMNLVVRRVRMEGFIMLDYIDRMDEAANQLMQWVSAGEIAWREDVQEGFEAIPDTFLRLFSSRNQGKQLLKLAEPV